MNLMSHIELVLTGEESEAVAWRCFVEKLLLEISQNSQEIACVKVSFFNEVACLRPATLLKRLWNWCFLVNFAKFLRTPLFTEHP